jgi:hypothetical protein
MLLLKDVDLRKEVERLRSDMKVALGAVKDDLDGHLDTINTNTEEIQQNYEFLAHLESKIDKLNERLDAIEVLLQPKRQVSRIELSVREQEIFLILYSSTEKLSRRMLSRRLGFTEDMVQSYLSNLAAKGIPILRAIVDGEEHFFIDMKFREIQAKQKIVPINEAIARELFT